VENPARNVENPARNVENPARNVENPARITVLAGGIGAARFLVGLRAARPHAEITVIGNTGDDIWLYGVKICPDLDTVMYTLGDGISAERGWGREDETFVVKGELAAYQLGPDWFGLGDRDLATHLVRTSLLTAGHSLSYATEVLCQRWTLGVRLIPMTDQRVETHVVVDADDGGTEAIHFQEWWIRDRAARRARSFVMIGIDDALPAPGVLEAIETADVVLLPPSNPVVSIGSILAVSGIRDALRRTAAPIVGVSPIIGGAPVRGMADACLSAIGVETSAIAVAAHYGARTTRVPSGGEGGGILDGWLIDSTDAATEMGGQGITELEAAGITCRSMPLLMSDVVASARIAQGAVDLARSIGSRVSQ